MPQDSSEIWKEMMSNWQDGQQAMAEQMMNGFKHWNSALSQQDPTQVSPMFNVYTQLSQALFKNFFPSSSGLFPDWEKYLSSIPNTGVLASQINKLTREGDQLLQKFFSSIPSENNDHAVQKYLMNALTDMCNPNSWLKYSGDAFDLGAHKLSEGPLFSGITDIDKRMTEVNDHWQTLIKCSKEYHILVFTRWTKAYARFIDDLRKKSVEDEQVSLNPKDIIDLWMTITNEELMALHRSEAFLTAQREVIRASMQYRLSEKKVAEVLCNALHIPTRDEVDDLHKTNTEIRRELRQLKQKLSDLTKNSNQKN